MHLRLQSASLRLQPLSLPQLRTDVEGCGQSDRSRHDRRPDYGVLRRQVRYRRVICTTYLGLQPGGGGCARVLQESRPWALVCSSGGRERNGRPGLQRMWMSRGIKIKLKKTSRTPLRKTK